MVARTFGWLGRDRQWSNDDEYLIPVLWCAGGMTGGAMDQHTIAINLAMVEAHGGSEAAGRVDEAVALYTDDIVWEAPSRPRRLQGQEAVAARYRQMFRAIKYVRWHGLDRFATEDRVVDDRVVSVEVATEGCIPLPIGTRGEMRLTHLFYEHTHTRWEDCAGDRHRRATARGRGHERELRRRSSGETPLSEEPSYARRRFSTLVVITISPPSERNSICWLACIPWDLRSSKRRRLGFSS